LDTTDLSRDRETIQRLEYVFTKILDMIPHGARSDSRYVFLSTMMKESLKDIALIPDEVIVPMVRECAYALQFVSDGSMAQLEEYLESERDNSEEG